MFNILNKKNQQKEVAVIERPRSNNDLVEEIHSAFYSEVDKLLEDSKVMFALESENQSLLDKRDKLMSLGFVRSRVVEESKDEVARLEELANMNREKEAVAEAIKYFSFKYPHYKFITEPSVKKLCDKYGLVYGSVYHYIGDVPDKNLQHIEQFKIDEQDVCWQISNMMQSQEQYRSKEEAQIECQIHNEEQRKYNATLSAKERNRYHGWYSHCFDLKLEIVAPQKMFDEANTKVIGNQIVSKDPIVLQPVVFKEQKYYLIVTAWGKEASDENVVNHNHN